MAAQTLVMYPMPDDPEQFDKYYTEVHTPIALKIPGLTKLEVSKGGTTSPNGDSPWYLIAELNYDSMAALQAAMGSPEAAAAVADLVNFAPEGTQVFIFETETK